MAQATAIRLSRIKVTTGSTFIERAPLRRGSFEVPQQPIERGIITVPIIALSTGVKKRLLEPKMVVSGF
tara:strand:- start:94 stop:300 length:207 start_codon:yes stop_codon:yes gene_type:complete